MKEVMDYVRTMVALKDSLEVEEENELYIDDTEYYRDSVASTNNGKEEGREIVLGSRMRPFCSEIRDRGGSALLLFKVDDNRCRILVSPHVKVTNLPKSWMEQVTPVFNQLAVQLISRKDRKCMTNKMNPQVPSFFISVYNFHLYGNIAKPVATSATGPFLSFLTADDDIDSLKSRLASNTGDSLDEISKCRIAFIKDRTPHYVEVIDESDCGVSCGISNAGSSIFAQAVKLFPQWNEYITKMSFALQRDDLSVDMTDLNIPTIGIQRYTFINNKDGLIKRANNSFSQGIKIA